MFINAASAASGAIIIGSLIVVGVLVNDLNILYSDVLNDMDNFKANLTILLVISNCFLKLNNIPNMQ